MKRMNQILELRMTSAIYLHDLLKSINQIMSFTGLKSPVDTLVPRIIQTLYTPHPLLPWDHFSESSLFIYFAHNPLHIELL